MEHSEKIKIFETYLQMCKVIADEICNDLKKNPHQLLCIAAGNTSQGVFEELIQRFQAGRIDFSQAYFISMDEWVGMNEKVAGSCGDFLKRNFLNHVNYQSDHVMLWDGATENLQKECQRAEAFLSNGRQGKIDYLVLGCGMNGHLALNEPGADFEGRSHVQNLDSVTTRVGQKYFEKEVLLEQGITLGIGNFKEAAQTVLMLNGKHKAEITSKIFEKDQADSQIPATVLYEFENGKIYCDQEAAGQKLTKSARKDIVK